jgi:hypothetical protein
MWSRRDDRTREFAGVSSGASKHDWFCNHGFFRYFEMSNFSNSRSNSLDNGIIS